MARDGYVTFGSLLTPEEAGMAQALLESEGVDALLEDQALSAVDPLVRLAIGGTKLLVRQEDLARAEALLGEAGVLAPASAQPVAAVEIPEEVWSAPPLPEPVEKPGWSLPQVLLVGAALAAGLALLLWGGRLPVPPFGPR